MVNVEVYIPVPWMLRALLLIIYLLNGMILQVYGVFIGWICWNMLNIHFGTCWIFTFGLILVCLTGFLLPQPEIWTTKIWCAHQMENIILANKGKQKRSLKPQVSFLFEVRCKENKLTFQITTFGQWSLSGHSSWSKPHWQRYKIALIQSPCTDHLYSSSW